MGFEPLKFEDLRLGLYVKIKGSWFSHPFPRNTFKISTAEELSIIRGLKTVELFVDPDLSDAVSGPSEMVSDADGRASSSVSGDPGGGAPEAPSIQSSNAVPGEEASANCLSEEGANFSHVEGNAVQDFRDHCEGFHKAEQVYQEAVQNGKSALQELSIGNGDAIGRAQEMINGLSNIIDHPEAVASFMNVIGANDNVIEEAQFLHSLNVCTLALLVGRELGLKEEDLHSLTLGALFHDIGELNVPVKILLKKPNFSFHEREIYDKHPQFGWDMIKRFRQFPKASLNIIIEHHERLDGTGYPKGLKGARSISPLSQIVMVVDVYDELTNHPDPARRLTPSDALSHLYVKGRKAFDNSVVVALVRVLGVYPPGSLVELNDGSVGLVVSINEEVRMRPLVLVYKGDSPSTSSQAIDLSKETDLSIVKNLRPNEVDEAVREYLHPRNMVKFLGATLQEAPVGALDS